MQAIGMILRTATEDYQFADAVKDRVALAKVMLTAADTSLKVQVRVDEARLRRKEVDIMPEIKRLIEEQRAKLKTIEAQS